MVRGEKEFFYRSLVVLSSVLFLGGLGYLFMFGSFLGSAGLSPIDPEQGIQLSPSHGCEEVCFGDYFAGCTNNFEDLQCGLSCKAVLISGLNRGSLPIVGQSLCGSVACVCD